MEDCLRLDIRTLRAWGMLETGAVTQASPEWRDAYTGNVTASVSLTINLVEPDAGVLVIRFTSDGALKVQDVQLESVPMRFGGRRYYFLCPRSMRRCEVLAAVGGVFACRKAHRLAYRTQSADALGRLHARRAKLERRAFPANRRSAPRGANREAIYERLALCTAELDVIFASVAARRFGFELPDV